MTDTTSAPTPATGRRRAAVSFDALLALRTPADAQISPDGTRIAFIVNEWVPDQPKQRGRLWLVDGEGRDARPITAGTKGDASPRWSPDGKQIAFISQRDDDKEQHQLYRIPADGGEMKRVCRMPNGASEPAWSPDGSRIAFLSLEGEPHKDGPKLDEQLRHQRLWSVRPDSDAPEPVTPPDMTVWRYAWSPDGAQLAVFFTAAPSESDWYRGQLGVVPATGGLIRQITSLTRQADAPIWSRDGTRLYYVSEEWSDRGLVGGDVYTVPIAGGGPKNLTPGVECSPSWLAELPEGGRLLYAAWSGLTNAVGILNERDGSLTPLASDFVLGDWGWPRLSASGDGRRFAAIRSDAEHPADVWLGELSVGDNGAERIEWRQLTHLNAIPAATLAIAPSRPISYESVDGWRIDALFTPPLDPIRSAGGTPPPLVLIVHGGPTSAYRETWLDPFAQFLAAAGFAVLRPNPRGSIGRGVAFADAVIGDPGGKDFQDCLRGVDYVIQQGWVDPNRTGIFGWSYGGFMTAWAVTQTTRFKAAVMGAGVSDFHSFHAQANIQDWDMRVLTADPLERPEVYRERSAITFAARVTTPTLIVHGEEDPSVPVNQAYAFYRALKERGVPTQLAVYPREGHGFRERDHLRDLYARLVGWFEKYL